MAFRSSLVTAALLASLLVPMRAPAEGVEPKVTTEAGSGGATVGECGGIAPIAVECSFRGSIPSSMTIRHLSESELVGRNSVRIVTSTGTYTSWCDFPAVIESVCGAAQSGSIAVGQLFNAYASVSFVEPAAGTEVKRVAAGEWRVRITSP